jgi:hypothetical protein
VNLARFGLTRNEAGHVVDEGSYDLVDISELEANISSVGVEVIDTKGMQSNLMELAREMGLFDPPQEAFDLGYSSAAMNAQRTRATRRRRSKPKPKTYVKRKKNTTKKFIARMKKKYELLDLKRPIREMGRDELLAHFEDAESVKSRYVDKKKFARNVIWQLYQEIQAGQVPEFARVSCNIRSIYYYLKTAILDNKSVFKKADNIYNNFTEAMQDLVLAGLISYKDFNIIDDRRSYRLMPPEYGNTNVILLAEKDSFVGRFFELGSQYGVMVQITKGLGSVLMVDTMLTEMFEAGYNMNQQLAVLSFCDFDPVGTSIPYHFAKHLRALGFSNIRNFSQYGEGWVTYELPGKEDKNGNPIRGKANQVRPCLDIVPPFELPAKVRTKIRHRIPASQRDDPSTAQWAAITKGVTGRGSKKYAISSEMFLPYLADSLNEKILPLLAKPPEAFTRRLNYTYLKTALREYVGARVEHGLFEPFL